MPEPDGAETDWAWALSAVEAGLVVEALGRPAPEPPLDPDIWNAARCAVGAKFLAVSTPRSLAVVGLGERATRYVAAQAAWAAAKEIRSWDPGEDDADLAHALAADIVIAAGPITIERDAIRGGTHISVVDAAVTLAPALVAAARVYTAGAAESSAGARTATLAAVVAGIVDGRQGDEITILVSH